MAEYHVENFGCRASRADGEAIAAELRGRGLMPAAGPAQADVVVINTCSVTAQADRTARAFIRRVQRKNPNARIVVTGCYAQRAPGEVAALKGVHAVVGNSHKALVSEIVPELAAEAALARGSFVPVNSLLSRQAPAKILAQSQGAGWSGAGDPPSGVAILADQVFAHTLLAAAPLEAVFDHASSSRQTRPTLKVQDGCGNRCSFCVIPQTRGPSRSLPLEECLRAARAFAAAGGQELVLSGINLGRWGRDLSRPLTLKDLVENLLLEVPRLRLSSIEPMDWTPELLELFSAEQSLHGLAHHAHLPLQSGSDAILRAMHRRYRPWHYAEKLRAIRERLPYAAIGADVMVGFPGESDALFEESFAFIESQPLTYLHLFPFSARPQTAAWELAQKSPVPPARVDERMQRLRRLVEAKSLAFRQSFVGRDLPAITLKTSDQERQQGFTRALTGNFLDLRLTGIFDSNQSLWAAITRVEGEGLAGEIAARSRK
ncbi:MAG TPA: radical SAM protein [Acidobacteriaceae bacterium]|nr:radical SAM protein [Acidobacteriaceae bacterium]